MHYSAAKSILIENGYIPLPIIPNEKRPAIANWTAPDYVPPNGYANYGVGIKCGVGDYPIAAVDLDITDEKIAKEMFDFVEHTFGAPLYRVGKTPKVLIPFRAEKAGWVKKSSSRNGAGRVEILGTGQQFVCFGVHPDTKKPYTWPGLIGDPRDNSAESLPILDAAGAIKIIEYFEALTGGKAVESKPALDFDPADPLDAIPPIGIPLEKVEPLLSQVDPDCSRDQWRNLGMALHHEYNGAPAACIIWARWSAGGSKYKEGEPEQQWESFGKYTGRPITAAYILKITKSEDIWTPEPDFFEKLPKSTSRFVSDPPAIPMVIDDLLPKGIVSLFYSAGGAGKSTIILYMAIKIALAGKYQVDFLGHKIRFGRVALLTAEDPDLILNRRFMGILNDLSVAMDIPVEELREAIDQNLSIISTFGYAVQLFTCQNNGTLKPTAYYKSFQACLKGIPDLQLVIIDTKTRFSPGEGLGNVTATQEITYYEAIAAGTGSSIMLLHHSNKSSRDGSQTGQQAYRDASAIFDSVRAAWYLRGLREDELLAQGVPTTDANNYLLLENSKNNYVMRCPDKIVHREGYKYSTSKVVAKITKTERQDLIKQGVYDRVVDALQNGPVTGLSQAELIKICSGLKVSRRKVVEAVAELLEDHLIEIRICKIVLTPEGRSHNLDEPTA
jgi:RecA-family ATPase